MCFEHKRRRRRKNLLTSSTECTNLEARRRPPGALWTRGAGEPSLEDAASLGLRGWSGQYFTDKNRTKVTVGPLLESDSFDYKSPITLCSYLTSVLPRGFVFSYKHTRR
eukprot:7208310-Prymnesium_polylepis.1